MSTFVNPTTRAAIAESSHSIGEEVYAGRVKAHAKHGDNSIEAVPGHDIARWLPILGEEFGEVCESLTYDKDPANLRAELVDLVTVGTAWIAAIDKENARG